MRLLVSLVLLHRVLVAATTINDVTEPEDDCPICLDSLDRLSTYSTPCTLGCKHSFHRKCVQQLMRLEPTFRRPRCPMCRRNIDLKSHSLLTPTKTLSIATAALVVLAAALPGEILLEHKIQMHFILGSMEVLLATGFWVVSDRISSMCEAHPRAFGNTSLVSLVVFLGVMTVDIVQRLSPLNHITERVLLLLQLLSMFIGGPVMIKDFSVILRHYEREIVRDNLSAARRKFDAATLCLQGARADYEHATLLNFLKLTTGLLNGHADAERHLATFEAATQTFESAKAEVATASLVVQDLHRQFDVYGPDEALDMNKLITIKALRSYYTLAQTIRRLGLHC